MRQSRSVLLRTVAIASGLVPAIALAQATPDAAGASSSTGQVETIVITARKRSENLLKVPVSVSALTAKDIEQRGIQTMDDVAKFTPGLYDNQASASGARTDRSFQQLVIRGMNPSSTMNPTTSVFINGAPVASSDFIQNLDDTERVEVLKGPQSAYFGRETFAGAINVISVSPGDALAANVSGTVGTRNTYNLHGAITVPIIADKLSVRIGGSYDSHDGSYKNAFNPSQTLGDQSTKSVHASILAKPTDNLTIKAFGMFFRDDDGPAATGIYLATGTAGGFNQGNCTVAGQPFFCGTLPALNTAQSPAQVTTLSPGVSSFLANPGGILSGSDLVRKFGLRRNGYHGDLNVNYDIPGTGATFTYLGGYNHDDWSELSDLANLDGAANGQYPGYTGFPYMVQSKAHDQSHELRIATDAKKPLRVLLGASYINALANQGLGLGFIGPGTVKSSGSTLSKTSGVFFSVAYDILPQLTVNFDGRYQWDSETALGATGAITAKGTTRNFLPRASIQYKIVPDVMAYATYSQGANPGVFNATYATFPSQSQAELNANGAGQLVVRPEKIANYEVGLKGRFLDGHATLAASLYYDKWTNQLNSGNYIFPVADPANPYNVVGGPQYVAGNTSTYIYSFTDNSAKSTAKGIEVDATIIPVEHVTLNFAGAINDTKYDQYNCVGTCAPYGPYNAAGKELPNAPKKSFSTGIQYGNTFGLVANSTWFARTDVTYRDGVFIQSSNTVKTPNIAYVNLRAGINFGKASVEAFVTNLFNNKSPVSGFEDVNFAAGFTPSAVMVGLPQLVTGGVKLSIKY